MISGRGARMRDAVKRSHGSVVLGLIVLGVLSRLIPHPWNVTPVMAIALFGGAALPRGWALVLPLAIVALSDLLIGWHNTVPFTWAGFLFAGMIGWWIRRKPSGGRIFAATLTGSVTFFVISNFGVWLIGDLYPRSLAGLWACAVAAIPFFRTALAGDLVYTGALFGLHYLVTVALPSRVPVQSQ